jgi:FMN phosphatase YigB (HAD superfamily)
VISDLTRQQLASLRIGGRPLVICDVDEVVVHFTRDFELFLGERGLWLDTSSFALNGNIREIAGSQPVAKDKEVLLVEDYFAARTLHQQAIDGAVEALLDLSERADVVMLTNLPHTAGPDRRRNLEAHGLSFPVITNSGTKGPAVQVLAAQTEAPVVFIDDSPNFLISAREHAPQVHLVHFLHDERFARHIPPLDFVSLRTHTWDEARPHVADILAMA